MHPLAQRREATIEWLSTVGPVQEAAVVARTFRIEPAALLDDDGDNWPMLVNLAAARYVARQEKAEQERNKRGGGQATGYRRPTGGGAGRRPGGGRQR